jgi:hypothetical protein
LQSTTTVLKFKFTSKPSTGQTHSSLMNSKIVISLYLVKVSYRHL